MLVVLRLGMPSLPIKPFPLAARSRKKAPHLTHLTTWTPPQIPPQIHFKFKLNDKIVHQVVFTQYQIPKYVSYIISQK